MRAVPVLEGPQERGKSTALAILGRRMVLGHAVPRRRADACLAIQGVWVYEIGEMQQFGRAEAAAVKQFVSSRVDHYRPPYGRRHINVPRQTVFAGTINEAPLPARLDGQHAISSDPLRRGAATSTTKASPRAGTSSWRKPWCCTAGRRRYPTREEAETLFAPEQEARMQEPAWEGLILEELERTTYKTTTCTASGGDREGRSRAHHRQDDGRRRPHPPKPDGSSRGPRSVAGASAFTRGPQSRCLLRSRKPGGTTMTFRSSPVRVGPIPDRSRTSAISL
jgi:hypothetical protein